MGAAHLVSKILPLYVCLQKWPNFHFRSWTIIHVLTSKTKINITANIFDFSFSECDIITFNISFSFSGQTIKI